MLEKAFTLFSKLLRDEVSKLGWKKPTLIQGHVIPVILKGEHVLLIAPTGTGKTEAALFPVFEQFMKKRNDQKSQGISILYITPLRALNRDILASNKRGVQLSIVLERLRALSNREFQRIGLSATIGSPELVAKFLVGKNRTIKIIKTDTKKTLEVLVESLKTCKEAYDFSRER